MSTQTLLRPECQSSPASWAVRSERPSARTTADRTFPSAVLDASAAAAAGAAVMHLRLSFSAHPNVQQHLAAMTIYVCLFTLSGYAQGLYRSRLSLTEEAATLLRVLTIAAITLAAVIYALHALEVSRFVLVATPFLTGLLTVGWRCVHRTWVEPSAARALAQRRVLIIGTGEVGQSFAHYVSHRKDLGYRVQGFINVEDDGATVEGIVNELECVARTEFIDEVVISVPSARELVKALAAEAERLHLDIKVIPEMYDGLAWLSPMEFIGDFPIRVLYREPIPKGSLFIKRILDVVAAGVGLLAISPLLAVIALMIKADSKGPLFYRARRLGQKGRPFTCFKFRTMVANADQMKESLQHLNLRQGALFKVRNDPRITRVGRFLRKYSLDELPQLWNVVLGEMSLVGPRPPEPNEVKQYRSQHLRRLEMTPGITGLWQVSARQDPSFETAVSLDTYYIENWSMWLDLTVLAKTAKVVLAGTGD